MGAWARSCGSAQVLAAVSASINRGEFDHPLVRTTPTYLRPAFRQSWDWDKQDGLLC